jgi:DNA relaxase NicK
VLVLKKRSAWIKRRDEGNARAAKARQEEKQRLLEERKRRVEEEHKKKVEMMMPVWNKNLTEIMERRDLELKAILQSV